MRSGLQDAAVQKLLYTLSMDAVRFGRALGFGARQAAKTLVTAVDAATTEDPRKRPSARPSSVQEQRSVQEQPRRSETTTPPRGQPTSEPTPTVTKAVRAVSQTVAKGQETQRALKRGRKRFGQAAMEPVVRLSGVLGLEVAGVFFGIFALGGLSAAWRLRGNWRVSGPGHTQLLGAVGMILVFGYFCITSFVRARRRERGR
jgi:hypothetical protein